MTGEAGTDVLADTEAGEGFTLDTNDIESRTPEEIAQDEKKPTAAEADAQLEAGFEEVAGTSSPDAQAPDLEEGNPEDGEKQDPGAEGEASPKAKASEQKVDPKAKDVDEGKKEEPLSAREKSLVRRLRNIEGTNGELNTRLDKLEKGEGEGLPAREPKLRDAAGLDKAVDEFAEMAPVKEELLSQDERVQNLEERPTISAEEVQSKIDQGILSYAHPDFEGLTKTPEFQEFMLEGGPSQDAFTAYHQARKSKSPAAQRQVLAAIEDWEYEFPEWWKTQGAGLLQGGVQDDIKLIERFKDRQEIPKRTEEARQTHKDKMDKRLRSSATPTGVSADPVRGTPDDDGLEIGLQKEMKRTTTM